MTIKDIARLAGVSISTVSKIINGKDEHINPQTRTRVLQIVKDYNFTPYGTVKVTSGVKKFVLGILLRSTTVSTLMLNGIMDTAQAHGYSILLLDSQEDVCQEIKHITALCANHVDGILWEPVNDINPDCVRELENHSIPYCLINSPLSESFRIDFFQMGYFLTRKMVEKKHTNIACLLKKGSVRNLPFLEGYRKCLYEYQITLSNEMIVETPEEEFIQKIMQYNITGAVSTHYETALDLYERMLNQHYEIPADFSLVCLKGGGYEKTTYPPISCIAIPYRQFGSYVCQELIQICEKSEAETSSLLFHPDFQFNHEQSISAPASLKEKTFIAVGSIHKDITFNVDCLPQLGNTLNIHNSATTIGGKGANQAVGVAKLGHSVCLIGAIGNDFDATFILNSLEKENVSARGVYRDKKNETGKAYIYTERDGESAITVLPGANNDLTAEDVENRQHLFHNACFCLLSSELPVETVIAAARTAKQYGVSTILKPTVLKKIPEELYGTIDILVPNRKEASTLCPDCFSVEEQADYFRSLGIPTVIITLGHKGCYLRTSKTAAFFPAAPCDAIDTTGGADAFIAALASYLYDGYSLENAVQIAQYAASFCVARQGVTSALIDRNSLELYIGSDRGDLTLPFHTT